MRPHTRVVDARTGVRPNARRTPVNGDSHPFVASLLVRAMTGKEPRLRHWQPRSRGPHPGRCNHQVPELDNAA